MAEWPRLPALWERRHDQDWPLDRQDDPRRPAQCYACRKPFTVRIGTIFEDSQPLRLWLQAVHLLCSSKKGISTRQLQRTLGCGMKTAWHLGHRIRFAMAPGGDLGPLGGAGKIVEADETELARSRKTKRPANFRRKTHNPIVMSLVSWHPPQHGMHIQ